MNGSNWRSTIGGAFATLGTALIGVGLVPQLIGAPSKLLTYIVVAGFICEALGKFFTALFSADAKTVCDLKQQVNANTAAVSVLQGNTEQLKKGTNGNVEPPGT